MVHLVARSFELSSTGEIQIVLKTSNIHCFYQPAASNWLLVTFNPMTLRAHGNTFWGESVARKNKISCLGIISAHPNWFPHEDMTSIIESSRHILDRYSDIVCYGMSMGGYGAIKYARAFGAKTVISFSPQYSINPQITLGRDERYTRYFDPALHSAMEIKAGDSDPNCFQAIFYDPGHAQDAYCANMYRTVGSANLIPLHHMGHGTIACFAGTEKTLVLFSAARDHDIETIRSAANFYKRKHANRLHSIALKAVRYHPKISFAIHDKYPEVLNGPRSVEFARQCIKWNRSEAAIDWTLMRLSKEPDSDTLYRQLGTLKFAIGDVIAGREALSRAFSLKEDDHHARLLAQSLLTRGHSKESVGWAKRAYSLNPQSAQNITILIQSLQACLLLDQARSFADEAVLRHPKNGLIRVMRERLTETPPSGANLTLAAPSDGGVDLSGYLATGQAAGL